MKYEELLLLGTPCPILLDDKRYGLIVRLAQSEAGVQVPGEEDMRWIALDRLYQLGDGALIALPALSPSVLRLLGIVAQDSRVQQAVIGVVEEITKQTMGTPDPQAAFKAMMARSLGDFAVMFKASMRWESTGPEYRRPWLRSCGVTETLCETGWVELPDAVKPQLLVAQDFYMGENPQVKKEG